MCDIALNGLPFDMHFILTKPKDKIVPQDPIYVRLLAMEFTFSSQPSMLKKAKIEEETEQDS